MDKQRPKIDLKTISPDPGLEKITTIGGRRSQGYKGMPHLTNRSQSQLSGPENETKLPNSPWNHDLSEPMKLNANTAGAPITSDIGLTKISAIFIIGLTQIPAHFLIGLTQIPADFLIALTMIPVAS